jgi:hypothetical protein
LGKTTSVCKKATYVLADQFVGGQSQNDLRRGIRIQAVTFVIDDQDSVERILKDGREFTIRGTKGLVSFSVFSAEMPERINI